MTCIVSGCDRPAHARGYCPTHYVTDAPCSVDGCDRMAYAKGMCKKHWAQARRTGDPIPKQRPRGCTVTGCGSPVVAKGMCNKHYLAHRRAHIPDPVVAIPNGRTPVTCQDCGRPICADNTAGPVLIAAARANHRRYCKKETAA